jgi:hypothetical protein
MPTVRYRSGFVDSTRGQWRSVLDDEDLAYYRENIVKLADPSLLDWVHQGQD